MDVMLRRSVPADLDFLVELERKAFPSYQQSSRRTLALSLRSSFQQVWVAEAKVDGDRKAVGSLVLYHYKRSIRIFSVVVDPDYQGQGIGILLLRKAEEAATERGAERISLEVSASNAKLVEWYKKEGFEVQDQLKDYYDWGKDGYRMVKKLLTVDVRARNRLANVIVVDTPKEWGLALENVEVISSEDYTSNKNSYSERALRVFNLCNSYRYQSMGYYVSLLASAREHRAIPSVTTIRDFKDIGVIRLIADEIDEVIQKSLQKISGNKFSLNIYFSKTLDPSFKSLGHSLYQMFEAPLIKVDFEKNGKWEIRKITPLSLNKVELKDRQLIQELAREYFKTKRFQRQKLKNYRYYLAVLVDPNEENPPSDKKGLKQFEAAAEKLDIYTEYITKNDHNRLAEFDALFIRETTNVNNHTYQIARKAYAEGLAVIDDPWSILRCSNKVYLYERLKTNNIPTPKTQVFYKGNLKSYDLYNLSYPMILKQPDSAFSLGVTKVKNSHEMKESLQRLFGGSDLVLGQEFMPSDYDWRIGVLDKKPLFACKYFMAPGHWQIYNWQGSKEMQTGDALTLPIEEVPSKVIQIACKAAGLMGDGLYGVDLKMVGDKVYVIEVNDNPNVDFGIEDKVLGSELYQRIVQSLVNRIEMNRNIERFVSAEPD
ncbi:GNAT family N-acetyltransferase [Gracilimonas mengyeensis]|uniref:Glutathione synthase/RimK-type ligase, ATP-grasp superfamily n=1 Tax=Gracilimonas mengyeensis TaxID=1302730 RepID=A0A521ER50_9BACT|nr:GNAT family N-acetyltransferase [Gracilimonas mengyeensis]SMO86409.1 Glutathione synthase/RimK-type ligase, ATP-grasp superfamily [Gracilimonas mengyeensis]